MMGKNSIKPLAYYLATRPFAWVSFKMKKKSLNQNLIAQVGFMSKYVKSHSSYANIS